MSSFTSLTSYTFSTALVIKLRGTGGRDYIITSEILVQSQSTPCGTSSGQSGSVRAFTPSTLAFSVFYPTTTPYRTTLQIGRSRVRSPILSLEFFSDINLPVALWPWDRLSL